MGRTIPELYKMVRAIQPAFTPAGCVGVVVPATYPPGWAIQLSVPRAQVCQWEQLRRPGLELVPWLRLELDPDGRMRLCAPNSHKDWFRQRYRREVREVFELEDPALLDQVLLELGMLLDRRMEEPA